MLDDLRRDAARLELSYSRRPPWSVLEALLFNNGFQAVVLYRIARWFRVRRIPLVPPLVARVNLFLTGVDINPAAEIGPGLIISHGVGLVVGGSVRVGSGALLLHGVTLGSSSPGTVGQMPVIGDNAFIGAGAKLIGGIRVGDDVVIGPNAVVTVDVPTNCKVLSSGGVEITPRAGD